MCLAGIISYILYVFISSSISSSRIIDWFQICKQYWVWFIEIRFIEIFGFMDLILLLISDVFPCVFVQATLLLNKYAIS